MRSYSDITLIPSFFKGKSRSEIDVSCLFLGKQFKLPVVPSNMSSVIDEGIAKYLSFEGYFYIMHRFFKEPDGNLKLLRRMNEQLWPIISISVGVQESDKALIKEIAKEKLKVDFITIDIAHGDSQLMKNMIWIIKEYAPQAKIIAGNVCAPQGAYRLIKWGADCVKVGIAQGGACSTYGKTGFGLSMPLTVWHLYTDWSESRFPIIIDGGVRTNGDIAKAIALAYQSSSRLPSTEQIIQDQNGIPEVKDVITDIKRNLPEVMVMAGSLFAACDDSPADRDDYGQKLYYGSASAKQKGHNKNIEGSEVMIRGNDMTYAEKLKEIEQDLQSAASYAGGRISDLCNVEIVNLNQ
jgi:GMP reductase